MCEVEHDQRLEISRCARSREPPYDLWRFTLGSLRGEHPGHPSRSSAGSGPPRTTAGRTTATLPALSVPSAPVRTDAAAYWLRRLRNGGRRPRTATGSFRHSNPRLQSETAGGIRRAARATASASPDHCHPRRLCRRLPVATAAPLPGGPPAPARRLRNGRPRAGGGREGGLPAAMRLGGPCRPCAACRAQRLPGERSAPARARLPSARRPLGGHALGPAAEGRRSLPPSLPPHTRPPPTGRDGRPPARSLARSVPAPSRNGAAQARYDQPGLRPRGPASCRAAGSGTRSAAPGPGRAYWCCASSAAGGAGRQRTCPARRPAPRAAPPPAPSRCAAAGGRSPPPPPPDAGGAWRRACAGRLPPPPHLPRAQGAGGKPRPPRAPTPRVRMREGGNRPVGDRHARPVWPLGAPSPRMLKADGPAAGAVPGAASPLGAHRSVGKPCPFPALKLARRSSWRCRGAPPGAGRPFPRDYLNRAGGARAPEAEASRGLRGEGEWWRFPGRRVAAAAVGVWRLPAAAAGSAGRPRRCGLSWGPPAGPGAALPVSVRAAAATGAKRCRWPAAVSRGEAGALGPAPAVVRRGGRVPGPCRPWGTAGRSALRQPGRGAAAGPGRAAASGQPKQRLRCPGSEGAELWGSSGSPGSPRHRDRTRPARCLAVGCGELWRHRGKSRGWARIWGYAFTDFLFFLLFCKKEGARP